MPHPGREEHTESLTYPTPITKCFSIPTAVAAHLSVAVPLALELEGAEGRRLCV